MAKGNRIVLTPDRGYPVEGIVANGETHYPGMVVQIDPSVTVQGNRHIWTVYNRDADGDRPLGPFIIITEDLYQGKDTTGSYSAGQREFGFIPLPGCELNLLLAEVAGTATIPAGALLIPDDGTGKWIITAGSPEVEPAMTLEAAPDTGADKLTWCIWCHN